MSNEARKINAEQLFTAIMAAATGTIKIMTNTLQAAKTIAVITYDVLETLKENGVIVEQVTPETPATNVRAISPESKIAQMACRLLLQEEHPEPEIEQPAPKEPGEKGWELPEFGDVEEIIEETGRVPHTVSRKKKA